MENYYILGCSNGKDSLALAYKLIELKYPLNEIMFYDTGMEFQAIYRNWEKLKKYAESLGIKCTRLYPTCPFTYKMFELPVNVGKENEHYGYSWCGGRCRWGTTDKVVAMDKYCENLKAYCYVGIASDETHRLKKKVKPYKIHTLVDLGMTELDCLEYCITLGIDWKEPTDRTATGEIDLYSILDRVSCWCCANKNHWELYNIWKYLPDYWNKLKYLQSKLTRPFKKNLSIFELEKRFDNGYTPKHRMKHK